MPTSTYYPPRFAFALILVAACGGTSFTADNGADSSAPTGSGSTTGGSTSATTGSTSATTGSTSGTTGSGAGGSTTTGAGGQGGNGAGGSLGTGGGAAGSAGTTAGAGGTTAGAGGYGGSSNGGASGTGGGSGTGGTSIVDGGACVSSQVTFRLKAPQGADYCTGMQCTVGFVTIKTPNGKDLSISPGCMSTCQACQPIACVTNFACVAPQHLKPEGETSTWAGSAFDISTCGANGLTCRNPACVPPGRYIATMCASRSTSDAQFCMGEMTPTCVDVPFDYPGTAVVEGVLP